MKTNSQHLESPKLPDHLRRLAMRVAQHEMGHYVVARALGFPVGEVSIEILGPINGHNGSSEIVLPETIVDFDQLRSYLQRRIIVLYAGALAETMFCNAPKKQVDEEDALHIILAADKGAKDDYSKIRELGHVLRNVSEEPVTIANPSAVQVQLDENNLKLWTRAIELVELHAETIIGLAANLADRVTKTKQKFFLSSDYLEKLPGVQAISLAAAAR